MKHSKKFRSHAGCGSSWTCMCCWWSYLITGIKILPVWIVIFVAVLLHNGFGYFLGYCAGKLTGMNTAKKRTISIEVGMQNAGLATNLATTTAQFASTPESAIICAVSCVWHSISGTLLAGMFAQYDKIKSGHKETATAK